MGRNVFFRGKVVESVQSGQSYILRINVTPRPLDSWDDTIWVDADLAADQPRILNGDIVDFRGKFAGIKSYQAVLGQTIQIPRVVACSVKTIDQNSNSHEPIAKLGWRGELLGFEG
jgi:hypothetical protein